MSDKPFLSAKRVPEPWRAEPWPACTRGHALMERVPDRYGFECPKCGWFLGMIDWQHYLWGLAPSVVGPR